MTKSYINQEEVAEVTFTSNSYEFKKKKRKLEREAKKMREEEARRISIKSFNRLFECGILIYAEGNK